MTNINSRFLESSARMGLSPSPEQAAMLLRWLEAVLDENTRVNLTALRTLDAALDGLLLDSLALELHLREVPVPAGAVFCDCGSGGGFPGVVAALMHPECTVHLVESRAKKLLAVQRALGDLPQANMRFAAERMETLAAGPLRQRVDLMLSRAVGSVAHVLSLCHSALKPGGVLVLWKSDPLSPEELHMAELEAKRLGYETLAPLRYVSFKPSQLVRLRKCT
jgi:16S rRNA (guanine527-N7)-methyltransferase